MGKRTLNQIWSARGSNTARSVPGTHKLAMSIAGVTDAIELHTNLRVIAIGRNLHHSARTMFVVPTQAFHELRLPSIAP